MISSTPYKSGVKIQLILWCLGLIAFVFFLYCFAAIGQLGYDAGHAASVARNLLDGNGLRTSIISNDALFAQGVIPATQTIWPPGMPLASAFLSSVTSLEPATSFVWINAIAHIAAAVLVTIILGIARIRWSVALAAGLLTLLIIPNWVLVIRGHSEPPMAAISLLLCLLTVMAISSTSANTVNRWVVAAIIVAACGFLIRYQSIALLGSILMVSLIGLTGRLGNRQSFARSAIIAGGLLLVASVFIGTNMLISGSPTGSDSPFNGRSLSEVASALELIPQAMQQPAFIAQLLLVLAFGVGTLWIVWQHANSQSKEATIRFTTLIFSSFTVVAIVALARAATFRTPAYPWIARYFVPSIPILVVALVMMMSLASPKTDALIQSPRAAMFISMARHCYRPRVSTAGGQLDDPCQRTSR